MQIETAVFKLWGQLAARPTGLLDQSNARMRAPISPPPLRKLNSGKSLSVCLLDVEVISGHLLGGKALNAFNIRVVKMGIFRGHNLMRPRQTSFDSAIDVL